MFFDLKEGTLTLLKDEWQNSRPVAQQAAEALKGAVDVLEQLRGFWNILGTKPSVYGAIFSNFQA